MNDTSTALKPGRTTHSKDWLLHNTLFWQWHAGPQIALRQQKRKSTRLASILAVNDAVCRETPPYRSKIGRSSQFVKAAIKALRSTIHVMRLYARQAKQNFGRSYHSQAHDIFRTWWFSDMPPLEYYKALMAQYRGGPEIFNYLENAAIFRVVATVQLDLYGDLPVPFNDKAEFGAWMRANGLPGPRELAVRKTADTPTAERLAELGDSIIIKPCMLGYGKGFEAFEKTGTGQWSSDDTDLTTDGLLEHIEKQLSSRIGGLVIQEKLQNNPNITGMCGSALSTCRFVTIRNENGDPEIVEHFWRMGFPGSLVDNYSAGGFLWMADNLQTGEIAYGLHSSTATNQRALTHHPISGDNMVGRRHPDFEAMAALALKAHSYMDGVFFAGWDIASTPNGPMLIEVNIPCQSPPSAQMLTHGMGSSRFGALLGFHAERWLAAHKSG